MYGLVKAARKTPTQLVSSSSNRLHDWFAQPTCHQANYGCRARGISERCFSEQQLHDLLSTKQDHDKRTYLMAADAVERTM